ncbi:MAG: UvrD-helicase domain-containing protein, partial [Pseudomonadota bacterium]
MSEQELIDADRRARADALDVSRSFIVQAPAGSGKTELLIQRYLTLLATVDEPEEVIAITFTRKATAEMRLRVIEALRNARRGVNASEPHLKITAAAAMRVLERGRERGWGLIRNPRRLRIQTLDALNGGVARMQPLTAATSAGGVRVADENELSRLYDDAAAATLDWIGEREEVSAATRAVLTHIDTNTAIYIGYLSWMLKTRDQWLPFVRDGVISDAQAESLRERFERSLREIVDAHLDGLLKRCPDALDSELGALANYAIDNLVSQGTTESTVFALGRDASLPRPDADDIERWRALAEFLLTKDGSPRKRLTKNEGFPAGKSTEKDRMLALLDSLREQPEFTRRLSEVRELPPCRYSDEQWLVLRALFRLLPVAVFELRRLCVARGLTDYIEIAMSAGEALGTADDPGDVALLLDYQLRHILIDEMQDTSKAQYRMLEALTGGWEQGDGRTLFCVGDPMQSIYRFRNAEVAQFLLARTAGLGSIRLEPLVLRRNFRSGEYLVDWFNAVFPEILAPEDDPLSGAVRYSTATSVPSLAGIGAVRVHPVIDGDVEAEARRGVSVIQEIIDTDATDSSRIAVLVRSRTQLPAMLAALREAGIAYEAMDIDRLTDLPEIIECLSLVRAATHTGDRVAWLGLLRSPWIGLGWSDLHTLVQGRTHEVVWDLLRD